MPIRQELFSPASAFLQGRDNRQRYDYGQTRNALAEQDLANAPAEAQRRNKLGDLQIEGAQQQIDASKAKEGYARLKQALDSGNPRAYVLQHEPELAAKLREHGVDLQSTDDASAAQVIEGFAREYAGKAGIAPTGAVKAQEVGGLNVLTQDGKYLASSSPKAVDTSYTLSPGQQRYEGGKMVASVPEAPKAAAQFVALTPAEIERAALPAGTSAQRDTATGKIDVLSKKDTTATLSQKDATAAKLKLTTIRVGRQQLEKIRKTFEEGKEGLNAFGPGQGMLPTQAGKKFDAAINQIRGTWTALKRVPGIGSMSDYESKMDAAQFPGRNDYESVIEQKLQGMEDQLALLESGYGTLLGGGSPEQSQQQQATQPATQGPQQPTSEMTATGPNGQKLVLRNGQWAPR